MTDRTSTLPSRPLIVAVAIGALALVGLAVAQPAGRTTPSASTAPVAAVVGPSPSSSPPSPASSSPASPAPSPGAASSGNAGSSVFPSCDQSGPDFAVAGAGDPTLDASGTRPGAPPRNGRLAGFLGVGQGFEPTGRARLVLLDPRTGSLTTVVRLSRYASGLPSAEWSPTGTAIAITSGTGGGFARCTAIAVLSDRHLAPVFAGRGLLETRWTPDGASLAVLSSDPRVVATERMPVTTLPRCGDACSFGELSWAPDGRLFATTRDFNDGPSDVVVVTVGTDRVQVIPHGGEIVGWLDARTVLLMRGSRPETTHWVGYRLDGSRHRVDLGVDAPTVRRLTLQPSPDFRSAAGSQCLACPFVGLHRGVVRVLWTGAHLPDAMTWSPDSRWIAFTVRRGGPTQRGTWLVKPDASGLRRISTRVLTSLDWGPAASR
jgi:dipeptidyl aminopeptidase/acylaminoacyl peptidase